MVELFIAFRYIKDRKFQSIFSILGVAISIMVFTVSLTVSNGLEKNMINSLLTLTSHITLRNKEVPEITNYLEIEKKLKEIEGITAVMPEIKTQTIVKTENLAKGVLAKGINENNIKNDLKLKILKGTKDLKELNLVLVGEQLSKEMGLKIGDKLNIVSAENKEIILKVGGIFKSGFFEYDSNLVIIPLTTMQILAERSENVTEIGLQVKEPQKVEEVQKILFENKEFENMNIITWKELNGSLLSAIKFEKFVLVGILSLLLIIASFAVCAILNMIVREKIKDIGILKSIGYTNKNIRNIFIIEGVIIGVIGMILASIFSPIILLLFKTMFKSYMGNSFYYLEELPLYISINELLLIYGIAFIVIFLSTLYPATRAANLRPVEALKYE